MGVKRLVICGGGTKGCAILGALHGLDLQDVVAYSGVSIGSFIAFALCVGMTPKEIFEVFRDEPILSGKDWKLENLLANFGLDDGSRNTEKLQNLCEKYSGMKDPTFLQLHEYTGKELYVTATNLTKQIPETFSHHTTPDMSIMKSLFMSSRIPIYFTKIEHNGDLYADGMLMQSIPLTPFLDTPHEEVLVIKFTKENNPISNTTNFMQYVGSIVDVIMIANKIDCPFPSVTITLNEPILKLDYSKEYADTLFEIGLKTIENEYCNGTDAC